MTDIIVSRLNKNYGGKAVINGLDLKFDSGGIYCIMGPSGCGKTTLLRIIAGLEKADSGCVTGVDTKHLSMVFQEDRLIKHLSALENCCITACCRKDAKDALAFLGMADSIDKPVSQLSGGMARRAAVARAMLFESDTVLLDEPFSGLDGETKNKTIEFVIQKRAGRTLICVTHSHEDACLLGADVIMLSVDK